MDKKFIKGLMCIPQPLCEHLSGEGTGKQGECVTLIEEVLVAIETLKKACLRAPVLSFADYNKPFLLETDVSKQALGAVLSHK